jgi:uncharacterized protein (TIGR03118 family)
VPIKLRMPWKFVLMKMSMLAVILLPVLAIADGYFVTNLVSDVSGLAQNTDSSLQNPWGIATSATSPFWVSNNGSGVVTLYNGSGVKQGLEVTIPSGSGAPTGVVFNVFFGAPAFNGDRFLFATQSGGITGWMSGTTAETLVSPITGKSYTGLALGSNSTGNFLYAANFTGVSIDVFDSSNNLTTLSGNFTDPNLPSGYAPYNIQNLNGKLYVTYAKKDTAGSVVPGSGNGFVSVFDMDGSFLNSLISNGQLNAPWGMALAPGQFGQFGNDLLVANFGDGTINAFDPSTGALLGTLMDASDNPITINGLHGLIFGNNGSGGKTNTLYFTAGIDGGEHGLFGSVSQVPIPGAVWLLGSGLLGLAAYRRRRMKG